MGSHIMFSESKSAWSIWLYYSPGQSHCQSCQLMLMYLMNTNQLVASYLSRQGSVYVMQLPRAPEAAAVAEAAKEAAEEAARQHQHALDVEAVRSLRMQLRTILVSLLGRRRYEMFAVPPKPDMDPEFWQKVTLR